MSFKKHMQKLPVMLADNTDTNKMTDIKEITSFIKNSYPKLEFNDWTYNSRVSYRFYYQRANGYSWYIRLCSDSYGRGAELTYEESLNGGTITLHSKTKENIKTIIDHAIVFLTKMDAKKNKTIKKDNMKKLGKAGQIKKKIKELHPNLTFERTKWNAYRFSNIHEGFIFQIPDSRVADREYRDDLDKMQPLFDWLVSMADVKPMPSNGLLKANKGLR
jgi:hypothetical protein